jgi:hypothetical protein
MYWIRMLNLGEKNEWRMSDDIYIYICRKKIMQSVKKREKRKKFEWMSIRILFLYVSFLSSLF